MTEKSVLMVAAENDALPGAKIGGVGDVIRDLPVALQKKGCRVSSVIPSYGFLSRLQGLEPCAYLSVPFGHAVKQVELNKLPGKKGQPDIYIMHHPDFAPQGETVYCHDGDDRPFATDATKYAFFCAAIARALYDGALPRPDVLHCHDWHAAFLLVLLRFMPQYSPLLSVRTVFSIHNLALQGVRPLRDDESSFEAWFPHLVDAIDLEEIVDPYARHCINPMRAGILLADKVHTVSPSYAEEILRVSDKTLGLYGGEGLERDLQIRNERGDLHGILNGCEYPKQRGASKITKTGFVKMCEDALVNWAALERELLSAHWLAEKRLKSWAAKRKPGMLVSSVGRVTEQKVRLLYVEVAPGITALDAMLNQLGEEGVLVMIGSGDKALEAELVKISARHANFLFLNGFSAALANELYALGDLFLMPSSFEPCGISQLLAMRAGQPCLVNQVGGLKDTVEPDKTGFAFRGDNAESQAKAMVEAFAEAIRVFATSEDIWAGISKMAKKARFTWEKSAESYLENLYS